MKFFERFEQASPKIINQLWQSDYLSSAARNEALALISPPLTLKLWVERLFLVLAALFITAGVLLFFAFNWADITPMAKLGGILAMIGALAGANGYLLRQGKVFAANLVLSMNAFIVGVFMAVFGQIYQTGADSYTLFLTWAIMILPWVVMARFAPLWVLWLTISCLAMVLWWDLRVYPTVLEDVYFPIIMSAFFALIYISSLFAMSKGESWLNKKWIKLLLAIGVFGSATLYALAIIAEYDIKDLDVGFWVASFIFAGMYLSVKLKKSIEEYSVGYFCLLIIVMFLGVRTLFEVGDNNNMFELQFLFSSAFVIGLFYYGYKYFRHVTQSFEGRIL